MTELFKSLFDGARQTVSNVLAGGWFFLVIVPFYFGIYGGIAYVAIAGLISVTGFIKQATGVNLDVLWGLCSMVSPLVVFIAAANSIRRYYNPPTPPVHYEPLNAASNLDRELVEQ